MILVASKERMISSSNRRFECATRYKNVLENGWLISPTYRDRCTLQIV